MKPLKIKHKMTLNFAYDDTPTTAQDEAILEAAKSLEDLGIGITVNETFFSGIARPRRH